MVMNEKIFELAKQAGFYFYDMHNVNGEDLGETIEADSWAAADKFAQLIVQEVLSVQEKLIAEGHNAWHLHDLTKEHFGVE